MILAGGKICHSLEQNDILDGLEEEINYTLSHFRLEREKVISAVDTLGQKILRGDFNEIIHKIAEENSQQYIKTAAEMMKRSNIEYRIHTELGMSIREQYDIFPPYGIERVEVCMRPLGTLFHIAAGNADGLPAFSVLEGLLTGNVNILKLPSADNGLTVEIFKALIEIEPELERYIYVFDTSSADIQAMRKMASMADGIVVWGGDEAVKAVRTLAPAGVKIIEWGHKLGFAYISGYENKGSELSALAEHIISTRQLLCSSCQTIYIDTENTEELESFCRDFLPYFEKEARRNPITDIGAAAEITLKKYTVELEIAMGGSGRRNKIFDGGGCSLTICDDSALELSSMYGNCLVKPLPEKDIVSVLRGSKGYLQTAGLICSREKRSRLSDTLIRAGVNRIMRAGNMSADFCGESHDGEYPLRKYIRIVNIEK